MPAPTPLITRLRCPRCERQPVGQVLRDPAQTTAAPYHYGLRCHVRVVGTGDTPEAAEAAALSRWYSRWPQSDYDVDMEIHANERRIREIDEDTRREGW